MMVALYLAMVLIGVIVGVLVGFQAPEQAYDSGEYEAQEWCASLLDDLADDGRAWAKDRAFSAMIDRILNRTVFVDWHGALTPNMSPKQSEAIKLLGRMQIAQGLGIVLDLSDELTTGEMGAPTYPNDMPHVQHKNGAWLVSWQGQIKTYTRKDNAIRGAHRMMRANNVKG